MPNTSKDSEMKRMLLFAASLASFTGFTQDQIMQKVISGFETANVSQIEAQLQKEVDFTLDDFEDFCTKSQVSSRLRDFFATHKPLSYTSKHEGGGSSNSVFKIGELETSKGTFRLTVYLEKKGEVYRVSQLMIEG